MVLWFCLFCLLLLAGACCRCNTRSTQYGVASSPLYRTPSSPYQALPCSYNHPDPPTLACLLLPLLRLLFHFPFRFYSFRSSLLFYTCVPHTSNEPFVLFYSSSLSVELDSCWTLGVSDAAFVAITSHATAITQPATSFVLRLTRLPATKHKT